MSAHTEAYAAANEERHAIIATVELELGPIDMLVNNVGGDLQRRFHSLADDDIEAVLSLNLTSAVVLSRLVLPRGPRRRGRVGARTAQEFGLTLSRFIASPRAVAGATVRAIVADRAEIAVVPGPGRTLRAVMDPFPGAGPALNRLTGTGKTMDTVAEHREQQPLARAAPQ